MTQKKGNKHKNQYYKKHHYTENHITKYHSSIVFDFTLLECKIKTLATVNEKTLIS